MIRALTIGFLTMSTAILSSAAAKAESCDWTTNMYEKKVSDVCQKELENKATNEQDKVYVRRMFKDWEPLPATTEVYNEGGLIQVSDETDGSLFQAQWVSEKPPAMWVNGVFVTDTSTDPSLYRRLERMFTAAEQQTPSTAWVNPFRFLFKTDEAQAAKQNRNLNAAFVYTLDNGFTGTAAEILTGEADTGKLSGALPDKQVGFIGTMFNQREEYQCNGKTISDTEMTIDGKRLKVHQASHSTFVIKGLVDGQDVQVKMHGRAMYPSELKQTLTNKKTGKRFTRVGIPCQNRYSKDLESACKDKWNEFAAKNEDAKTYLATKGKDGVYGKNIKCSDLYQGKESREKQVECLKFFRDSFPRAGLRFHADAATFSLCADRAGKASCEEMKKGAQDVLATADPRIADKNRAANFQVASAARKEYREALQAAGLKNVDEYCKMPEAASGSALSETGNYNTEDTYSKCKMPLKGLLPKDSRAAANLRRLEMRANNPNKVEFEGASSQLQAKVERRMMGLMMLGDCCNDQRCSQNIFESRKINLKGAVQGPAAPVKQ